MKKKILISLMFSQNQNYNLVFIYELVNMNVILKSLMCLLLLFFFLYRESMAVVPMVVMALDLNGSSHGS